MIEITFNDSSGGGLKEAQSYGDGEYEGCAGGFAFFTDDGSVITEEEAEKLRKQFEDDERKKWESAKPLGGNGGNVFPFHLMLSIGDIAEDNFFEKRKEIIKDLWYSYPDAENGDEAATVVESARLNLKEIEKRINEGEPIRIWYSSNPDELCGFFWFMSLLAKFPKPPSEIIIVRLPDFIVEDDGIITTHNGWGEAHASLYSKLLNLQQIVPFEFCKSCVTVWGEHQEENAALRVAVSGQLTSVPVDFFDEFIKREYLNMKDEFREGSLIGSVMAHYELGINDSFLNKRIDEMINKGLLEVVRNGQEDSPYSRVLKKTK